METSDVKKALEDVSEIKRIFLDTYNDFSQAVKLFFIAGFFWLVEGVATSLNSYGMWRLLPEHIQMGKQVAVVSFITQGITMLGFLAVLVAYLNLRKKQKLYAKGLGLQLIDMWGCLLLGITLYGDLAARLSITLSVEKIARYVSIPYMFLMAAIPLMFFVTGVLVNRKAPKVLALIYALTSLILMILPTTVEYNIGQGTSMSVFLGTVIGTSILPGTFLILLGYLMRKKIF